MQRETRGSPGAGFGRILNSVSEYGALSFARRGLRRRLGKELVLENLKLPQALPRLLGQLSLPSGHLNHPPVVHGPLPPTDNGTDRP